MVWAKLATVATAFGQTSVRRDGTMPDRLTTAWLATADRLPLGWVLAGVRYVVPEESVDGPCDVWQAVASGPSDEQRVGSAADAPTALRALADSFGPD